MIKKHVVILFLLCLLLPIGLSAAPTARIIGGVESNPDDWPFMSALMLRVLGITLDSENYIAYRMAGSSTDLFDGELVNCEQGFSECQNVEGKICLIERGETFFSEKVENCEIAGGIAAVIYNNEEGIFLGTLGSDTSSIPALSVSRETGLVLLNHLNEQLEFGYTDEVPTRSFCGASYIGGKWLITAAHCVDEMNIEALLVNVGGHDLDTNQENIFSVSRVLIHEEYDSFLNDNDIALVELTEEPMSISALKLADVEMEQMAIQVKQSAMALGRGLQTPITNGLESPHDDAPSALFEVELEMISNNFCNDGFNNYYADGIVADLELVTDNMICAGTPAGDVGTCLGDSGGPLLLRQDGESYLVGLTSWGVGCAVPGIYDVFSRVAKYKSQIEAVTSGNAAYFGNNQIENGDGNNKNWLEKALSLDAGWLLVLAIMILLRFSGRIRN